MAVRRHQGALDYRHRIEEAVALKIPRLSRKENDASVKTCAVHGFEQNLTGPDIPASGRMRVCHFTAVAQCYTGS
jgi:hypothetical protein